MLSVVSNTTPIISLLKLEKLYLLQKLYNQIIIPKAVFDEIEAGKNKVYYKDLSKIEWINIRNIQNTKALNYFLDLDAGEAEAIIMATEINADLILIDEKLGRFHAKHAGLKITGTVGILLKAKAKGYIKEIKPLLEALSENNVWISENLKREILKIAKEID